jgi:hypothetical protein
MIASFDPSYEKRPGNHIPGSARAAQEVYRAHDPTTATVEHMGVYHRGTDVAVSEEFLDGADVIPRFQEMGCKGVPERISTRLIMRR